MVIATLPAVNNADTYDTGLASIETWDTHQLDTANASDRISVLSISGGVLTFSVAGTARVQQIQVTGLRAGSGGAGSL
jgi:hypothetical protein